jgi:hypothetical protein
MAMPELDIAHVKRWCSDHNPTELRDQRRIECDITAQHLTILECTPPWNEDHGPEWTRFPIARFRYVDTRQEWELFWRDRKLRWRRFHDLPPTSSIQALLDEIDSPTNTIFWA